MPSEDSEELYAGELHAGWSRSAPEPAGSVRRGAAASAQAGRGPAPAALEPRGVGAILDTSLDVLGARFAACLGLSLGVWLPVAAVERVLDSFESLALTSLMVTILLQFFAQALVVAVLVNLVYGHLQGRRVSAWSSLGTALRRGPALIAAALLAQIGISLGAVCCLVPGLLVAWRVAVAPAALVLEGLGPIEALVRSSNLARGSFGRWLGIVMVQFALVLPVTTVVGVLAEPRAYGALLEASGMSPALFALLEVGLRALLMGLATSFAAVVLTVLYIDFRVRTEGFDLVMRLERLAASHPAAVRS